MKKIFICLLTAVCFIFSDAIAQVTTADSLVVLKKLERMKKELNLSEEQTEKIKPLLFDQYEKNKMFSSNIDAIRSVREQNDESAEFQLSQLLTPEQKKQYQQNKEQQKARANDRRIREKMAFYKLELKLSDQQYTDLKLLLEKFSIQKDQLKGKYKNNNTLLKEELKKLRKEFNEQLTKVLSKEQIEKYKELQNPEKK
jgi:hypothetical protein